MKNDPSFQIVVQKIDMIYDRGISRSDADMHNLLLEKFLANTDSQREDKSEIPEMENHVLDQYMDLSGEELSSFSPSVHTWFLNRLRYRKDKNSSRKRNLFINAFIFLPSGISRYLAVKGLIEQDLYENNQEISSINNLAQLIFERLDISNDKKTKWIRELGEILAGENSPEGDRALRNLLSIEKTSWGRNMETFPVLSVVERRERDIGEVDLSPPYEQN